MISAEEESLLLSALRRANHGSAFWRERLHKAGIGDRDFVPGFDFTSLPLIDKKDILADQGEAPPFGRLLAVPESDVRRVHKTSGTTAMPFLIALTEKDIADTYTASARAFAAAGLGPGQKIVHCLNFNMWSGGVTDYMPLERMGATCIPFGVGNTSMLLRIIKTLGVNAISSTPSYMFTLRDRCIADLGIDPKDLGLRFGYFGGEGLLQVPGVREEIEDTFGMVAYDANYGMSEVTSIIGGEGPERDGLIYHCHGILHAELVDGNDRPIAICPGTEGELVFSSLRREGQPLFRYRTRDIARILATDIGEDGLLRMRFRIIGRADDMMVLRGVNFFPQSLLSVINEFGNQLSHEFQVVRPRSDRPEAVTVLLRSVASDDETRANLADRFVHRASELLQVQVRVHWAPMDWEPVVDNKFRYVTDNLPKGE